MRRCSPRPYSGRCLFLSLSGADGGAWDDAALTSLPVAVTRRCVEKSPESGHRAIDSQDVLRGQREATGGQRVHAGRVCYVLGCAISLLTDKTGDSLIKPDCLTASLLLSVLGFHRSDTSLGIKGR
jgi:hypothetical protein